MQPNTEMSSGHGGFDLKAAREICSRIKGYEDPDGGNSADFQAAEMLPTALDEIERQAKRIAELEAENSVLRCGKDTYESVAKTSADRIAELENALVEERAKRLVADRGDCPYRSPIKNQLISRCDKGIICDWCQCPIKDEWRDEAREQLRLEGKI